MRSLAPLADLAERQYGVVTYRQMRDLGLSNGHIHRASKASRLRRVHRGVYAVGHDRLSHHGLSLAAVLACGSGAVLSHRSAAWLWGFLSRDRSRAIDRAKRTGRLDLGELDEMFARRGGTPNAKVLRQALTLYRKPVYDRARSELLFLEWEIDAYWPAQPSAAPSLRR